MRTLAIVLAASLLLTHYAYLMLPDQRSQAWAFYVAQGLDSLKAHAIIGMVIVAWAKPGKWRRLGIAAIIGGMLEQGQVSLCGIASYLRPIEPAPWEGLCGAITGIPLAAIGLVVAVLWLSAHIQPDKNNRGRSDAP